MPRSPHEQAEQSPIAKMRSSRVVCSVGRNDELIDAVGFEAGDILQEIGRLDARGPDDQFGGDGPAVRQVHTVGTDLGDLGADQHIDPQPGEQLLRLFRNAFGQRRKHPFGGFDQRNPDVLLGIDLIEAVRHHFTRRSVEFGRKFDAGRAGPDDGDLQLVSSQRRRLGMRADARIDHSFVEPPCIRLRFELDRMVHDARRAKVVVLASDGDDKDVVVKGPLRRDFAAFSIEIRRHLHLTPLPIDPDHVPDPVAKAVPVGLREIVDLVGGDIHAAGGDFVKLRLPHMRAVSLDQRDVELSLASVFVAKAGRKLQSAGSASDDHDPGFSQLRLTHDGLDRSSSQLAQPRLLDQALSDTASATATAAMFTMRRTVDDGVRMWAGFAAPSRMPPTVSPCPAAIRSRL